MHSPIAPRLHARAAVGLALIAFALIATLSVAALTRPVDRQHLPTTLAELRPELRRLHRGEAPCVRWSDDAPLTPDERERFLHDLDDVLAVDLRTLLPTLAAIRLANHRAALTHHDAPPEQEVAAVAATRLDPADRLRVALRPERLRDLLPRLEQVEGEERRLLRDDLRAQRLRARLPPEDAARLDDLIQRWRAPLASPSAQEDLVQNVAARITQLRLQALRLGLIHYRDRFGSWPSTLQTLLAHLRAEQTLDPILDRGLAPDGSLRDGWLRPFTYYRLDDARARLISDGPAEHTGADDVFVTVTPP